MDQCTVAVYPGYPGRWTVLWKLQHPHHYHCTSGLHVAMCINCGQVYIHVHVYTGVRSLVAWLVYSIRLCPHTCTLVTKS